MSYRNQPVRELTVVEALRKELGADIRTANARADKAERERDMLSQTCNNITEMLNDADVGDKLEDIEERVAPLIDERTVLVVSVVVLTKERDEAEKRHKHSQDLMVQQTIKYAAEARQNEILRAQVDVLTKERDDLAQFRREAYDELNACKETMLESQKAMKLSHWANEILKRNLKETEQERDAATAQVEALTKEREAAHAELEDLGAPDNRCCGYPLNQQQAELSLVERIAIIGNRLAEAENTATAQVEMLAGVVREARSLLRGEQESPYDLTIYGGPNGGMNVVRIERIIQQTDKALSSLPHAVERWAKMQAVCEAAKVAKNALDPCQKMTTSGLFAAFQRLRDALDDLAKVVG